MTRLTRFAARTILAPVAALTCYGGVGTAVDHVTPEPSHTAPISVAPAEIPVAEGPVRVVTIAEDPAAWLLVGNSSQWLEPSCRTAIEAAHGPVPVVPWEEIEGTVDPPRWLGCEEIIANLTASPAPATPTPTTAVPAAPAVIEREVPQLDHGINLAGDLEVEPRGAWGSAIEDDHFAIAAAGGFDHVRLPIRWSSYTGPAPAYTIDESFAREVDEKIDLALAAGLTVVIDVHHFEELDADPVGERDRFLSIWRQLSVRYQNQPETVVFELLNEPVGAFSDNPDLFNDLAADALAIVRQTNPTRQVIIGPVRWNHPDALDDLVLPNDPNLIATVHMYDPEEFTVQGASYIQPMWPTGVTWRADDRRVNLGWRSEPWSATTTRTTSGIRAEFERQFAAIAVVATTDPVPASTVSFTVDRRFDATVVCDYLTGEAVVVELTWNATTATGDTTGCGSIDSIAIQTLEQNTAPVLLSRWELCTATCEPLVVTQAEALDRVLAGAAAWAAEQQVPMYLGEFGTYDAPGDRIDPASRFAWTQAMRRSAERHNIGWAIFEMTNQFGAWDQDTRQWRPEVYNALFD